MQEKPKVKALAWLLFAKVVEKAALRDGDLAQLRNARDHKKRAQELLNSQRSQQTSMKPPESA